ncbi:MAG: hypothetical protein LBO63_01565, partial [Oscillospiraceae bacterium]|nr:hypothetical protein [Oscillospiraceae bacterium]
HQGRWCVRRGAATRGGGYFFPLRRKKVTKKGATSLEEAILFLYGNSVAAMETLPFPATYCGGVRECFRCAARRVKACRGVGDSGKTVACRKLPTGANRKVLAATIAAAHCAAMRCVTRRDGRWCDRGVWLSVRLCPRCLRAMPL